MDVSTNSVDEVEKDCEAKKGEELEKNCEAEANETRNLSIKDYCKKQVAASLVTGVSNIVEVKSRPRKIFKLIVLLFCLCAFVYQLVLFIEHALTYPFTIHHESYVANRIELPAYSFCNANGIRRSVFCRMYPDFCYTPENIESFCQKHYEFCDSLPNKKNFKIPKPDFWIAEEILPPKVLNLLGQNKESYLRSYNYKEEFINPYTRRAKTGQLLLCYSKNVVLGSNETLYKALEAGAFEDGDRIGRVDFVVDHHEIFDPNLRPGIYFAIHSQYKYQNPVLNGIFLQPGRRYSINMQATEITRLPLPYSSNCTNYTKLWEESEHKIMRSKEANIAICQIEEDMRLCHCSNIIPDGYPFVEEICDAKKCNKRAVSQNYKMCYSKFTDSCTDTTYTYEIQESFYRSTAKKNITVEWFMRGREVNTIIYRPQYESIDIFSYIGGLIGIWLGVSLMAFFDILESIFMVIMFSLRSKVTSKK